MSFPGSSFCIYIYKIQGIEVDSSANFFDSICGGIMTGHTALLL